MEQGEHGHRTRLHSEINQTVEASSGWMGFPGLPAGPAVATSFAPYPCPGPCSVTPRGQGHSIKFLGTLLPVPCLSAISKPASCFSDAHPATPLSSEPRPGSEGGGQPLPSGAQSLGHPGEHPTLGPCRAQLSWKSLYWV